MNRYRIFSTNTITIIDLYTTFKFLVNTYEKSFLRKIFLLCVFELTEFSLLLLSQLPVNELFGFCFIVNIFFMLIGEFHLLFQRLFAWEQNCLIIENIHFFKLILIEWGRIWRKYILKSLLNFAKYVPNSFKSRFQGFLDEIFYDLVHKIRGFLKNWHLNQLINSLENFDLWCHLFIWVQLDFVQFYLKRL